MLPFLRLIRLCNPANICAKFHRNQTFTFQEITTIFMNERGNESNRRDENSYWPGGKGAITSQIKHAIKHKPSPARLAQLLQPSLAFCFGRYAVIGCKCKLKQNANKVCNSCASLAGLGLCFIACFI